MKRRKEKRGARIWKTCCNFKRSHLKMSFKKAVLKTFAKVTGKYLLCRNLFTDYLSAIASVVFEYLFLSLCVSLFLSIAFFHFVFFLCVCVFLFYCFIGKIFIHRSDLGENICLVEIFKTVYLTRNCSLNKHTECVPPGEDSKTLRLYTEHPCL